MTTRSIDAKRIGLSAIRPRAVAMLLVTLAACGAVAAQERNADVQPSASTLVAPVEPTGTSLPTDPAVDQDSSSVTVSAAMQRSERWDGFRRSVASAATPSCFGPDALPHEEVVAEGLLRLPLLVHAAATGACR